MTGNLGRDAIVDRRASIHLKPPEQQQTLRLFLGIASNHSWAAAV
jgi:hypothetical protein